MDCYIGEEYYADRFASILILPENGITSMILKEELSKDKVQLHTILKLAQYFSCSCSDLLYRLKDLKLISALSYDKYWRNVINSAVQYGFNSSIE